MGPVPEISIFIVTIAGWSAAWMRWDQISREDEVVVVGTSDEETLAFRPRLLPLTHIFGGGDG